MPYYRDLLIFSTLTIGTIFPFTAALAQSLDAIENPYYRFSSVIPDALIDREGTTADLIVEFWADQQGNVARSEFGAALSPGDFTCTAYRDEDDALCYCREWPEELHECTGRRPGFGPQSIEGLELVFDVEIFPNLSESGELDFEIQVESFEPSSSVQYELPPVDLNGAVPAIGD